MRPYLLFLLLGIDFCLTASAQDSSLSQQNAILKAQNAILSESNKDVFSVLYWSLGFVATFLLAGTGLVSFFQIRKLSEDKESLRREIYRDMDIAVNQKVGEIEKRVNDLSSSLSENLTKKSDDLANSLKAMNEEADNKQDKKYSQEIEVLSTNLEKLRYEQAMFRGSTSKDDVPKLLAYMEAVETARAMKRDYLLNDALESLLQMEKMADIVNQIPMLETRIITLFDSLDPKHKVIVNRIREKIYPASR
jgi:gas vesicle protein